MQQHAQSNPPASLDLSLARSTESGTYIVQIEPPAPAPKVNQIHSWQIELRTKSASLCRARRSWSAAACPSTGHGFPTEPRVTAQSQPGHYLLEGMKFNMDRLVGNQAEGRVAARQGRRDLQQTVLPAKS
jgi:hypothetical protein